MEWRREVDVDPLRRFISPVVPVVVSQDPRGWRSPRALSEFYAGDAALLESLRGHVPELHFLVDDLVKTSEEVLGARTESPYLQLVFWMLRSRGQVQPDREAAWTRALVGVLDNEDRDDLEALLMYLVETGGPEGSRGIDVACAASREIEAEMTTLRDQWVETGREHGLREGIALGRNEGRRALLRQLLVGRFGALPESIDTAIADADEAQLDHWAQRFVTAAALDDVFT